MVWRGRVLCGQLSQSLDEREGNPHRRAQRHLILERQRIKQFNHAVADDTLDLGASFATAGSDIDQRCAAIVWVTEPHDQTHLMQSAH
jgi:hypothetical protein